MSDTDENVYLSDEAVVVDLPPPGVNMYDFEPAEQEELAGILQERQKRKVELRRYNKVLGRSMSDDRLLSTDWCVCNGDGGTSNCGNFHRLPKSCFCCNEAAVQSNNYGSNYKAKCEGVSCICLHPEFYKRALDTENLKGWSDLLRSRGKVLSSGTDGTVHVYTIEQLRYAAYRSITLWIHGSVGARHRIPLSSCVVHAIRKAFPTSVDTKYTDYRSETENDETSEEED